MHMFVCMWGFPLVFLLNQKVTLGYKMWCALLLYLAVFFVDPTEIVLGGFTSYQSLEVSVAFPRKHISEPLILLISEPCKYHNRKGSFIIQIGGVYMIWTRS
ncbi:hypothetical protein FRX31_018523 [Thalictrum thalictroides]|uniref:Uncharacterized protein n=1 Tax=Thalictrum thalictroides TaxID=46969 RepID=A0A7J6W3C8_THATH|nr:hypothetical protein FRX31_018523 [Thalictrum thalictroides]